MKFDFGQGLPDYGDGVHEHIWEVTSSFSARRNVAGIETLKEMLRPGGYFDGFDWQKLYEDANDSQEHPTFTPFEGWLRYALEETILGPGLWALMGLEEHEGAIDDMEEELEVRHDLNFDYSEESDYE